MFILLFFYDLLQPKYGLFFVIWEQNYCRVLTSKSFKSVSLTSGQITLENRVTFGTQFFQMWLDMKRDRCLHDYTQPYGVNANEFCPVYNWWCFTHVYGIFVSIVAKNRTLLFTIFRCWNNKCDCNINCTPIVMVSVFNQFVLSWM